MLEEFSGKMKECSKHIPNCICCNLNNNYVAIFPNELESTNKKTGHLKTIKTDKFGGKVVSCTKQCGSDDYKPLDCRLFPFFPRIVGGKVRLLFSKKCPLKKRAYIIKEEVLMHMQELCKNKQIAEWINTIEWPRSYGYELIP